MDLKRINEKSKLEAEIDALNASFDIIPQECTGVICDRILRRQEEYKKKYGNYYKLDDIKPKNEKYRNNNNV